MLSHQDVNILETLGPTSYTASEDPLFEDTVL